MRKLSSHYCLSASGEWSKRPIIQINAGGLITGFKAMGDEFKEEPSLEYFPGVIIPSFIGVLNADEEDAQAHIKRMVIDGCRRFLVSGDKNISFPSFTIQKTNSRPSDDVNLNPWEEVKSDVLNGLKLSKAISKQTIDIAKTFGVNPDWGVINEGSSPGLILIQGLDLRDFSFTAKTKIKVLVN